MLNPLFRRLSFVQMGQSGAGGHDSDDDLPTDDENEAAEPSSAAKDEAEGEAKADKVSFGRGNGFELRAEC
jgi:hypothetical protein